MTFSKSIQHKLYQSLDADLDNELYAIYLNSSGRAMVEKKLSEKLILEFRRELRIQLGELIQNHIHNEVYR